MAASGNRAGIRAALGVVAASLLMPCFAAPASAQGIFESIFGGLRHATSRPQPPADLQSFVEPSASLPDRYNPPMRAETGPARAFCVRTCDGRYFPVQARAGLSAAEACRSFCPASQTRLYSGGSIDYAVTSNGSRYADLDNAFVYRRQLVAGCTCNGRDAFGLAHIDAASDPTLRPGDVIATKSGLMAFTGGRNKTADFTPVGSYGGFAQGERNKLSALKVRVNTPATAEAASSPAPAAANDTVRRSAQLSR
ncbi:MAG: DUF2865 domain-containing protein [Rhizobiales bacterium]|nr:DUF2865 domain-containing protein [Hyphomicrobiales bacterium]